MFWRRCAECSLLGEYKHSYIKETLWFIIVLKVAPPSHAAATKRTWKGRLLTNCCSRTSHFSPVPAFLLPKNCCWLTNTRLNPSGINYSLFPKCPQNNLGSRRWITLHTKSTLNMKLCLFRFWSTCLHCPSRTFQSQLLNLTQRATWGGLCTFRTSLKLEITAISLCFIPKRKLCAKYCAQIFKNETGGIFLIGTDKDAPCVQPHPGCAPTAHAECKWRGRQMSNP